VAAYAVTVALFAVLCLLAGAAIDPVRLTAPNGPTDAPFRQHGKPTFSATGSLIWLIAIAVYIAGLKFLFNRGIDFRLAETSAAFITSALIVAFVHPLLIPLLLPDAWRAHYVHMLEIVHSPVGASRIGLNVVMLLTVVSAIHAIIMAGILWREPGQ
jgi:hypothetical protein